MSSSSNTGVGCGCVACKESKPYSPNKMEGANGAICQVSDAPSGRTQRGCDLGWIPSDHTIHLQVTIIEGEGRSINSKNCIIIHCSITKL